MKEIVLRGFIVSMARSHKLETDKSKEQYGGTWIDVQPDSDQSWREKHRLLVSNEEAKSFAVGQEIEIVFRTKAQDP